MKKLSIKIMSCMLITIMLASLLLAGCDSNNTASDGENSQSGQAATDDKDSDSKTGDDSKASGLKGTITYWSHNNPAFVEANKKLIKDFIEQNPGVKINYQNFPYDVTMQKMKASYAAKNEADIIQAFGAWMPPYLQQNVIADVPAEMSADFGTKFYDGAIAGYMKDGKYYGIPRETNVEYGLYYVPDKMKAAGIEGAPQTFEDLLKVAKSNAKFSNGGLQYGGFEFYNYDDCTFLLLSWIKQLGGDYWAEDGKHINLQTEQAEQAWQRMIDLITVDKVTDVKHITSQIATEQYFFSGKAALIMKGPWAAAIGDELKNNNWSYAILPSLNGSEPTYVVEPGWGEVVSARSKNSDIAWAFLDFACNTENSKYWNMTTATLPAIKDIAEDEAFTSEGTNERIKEAFTALQYAIPIGPVQDSDFMKKTIMDTFLRCVTGKQDTKTSLKFIQDEVNKHIDQLLAQ